MFDGFENPYAEEAEQRWGHTDAYKQSAQRTKSYVPEDWQRIKVESGGITQRFAELMRAGEPAGGGAAVALAEEHRTHISRWFYDCSPQMHRGLGEMYVADPRFSKHWDDVEPGLAAYVAEAFAAAAG